MSNEPQFQSDEEKYFSNWLDELKQAGFVKEWIRVVNPIPLSNSLNHTYTHTVKLKTKTKHQQKNQAILRASEYTPDFFVEWNEKALGIFFGFIGQDSKITTPFITEASDFSCLVEIKGDFVRHNMLRVFEDKQKFIWDKHKIYVNLASIPKLFKDTFTPEVYFFTPTGRQRQFNSWTPLTLKQFLSEKNPK